MGFPNSVFTFTSKSAGQTIQSATINDLQNELAAVETGLVAGPINLQASTIANLSVTGGSTLASLNVTGNSTFVGPVTFSTFATQMVPMVRLSNSANQDASNVTGVNWDTEDIDNAGMHSTSVNSSRITFTASTGWYVVGANVTFNPNSSGVTGIRFMFNDLVSYGAQVAPAISGGFVHPISATALVRATSTTDYVTLQTIQTSGSTRSLQSPSTTYGGVFWAMKASNA